jgi:hypothetical protein
MARLPRCPLCGLNPVPVLAGQSIVLCARCLEEGDHAMLMDVLIELRHARVSAAYAQMGVARELEVQTRWQVDEALRRRRREEGY